MEELKRKVKDLVTEDRHSQVDKVFNEWINNCLRTPRTSNTEDTEKCTKKEIPTTCDDDVPLKLQIEDLKKQIESFKEKMKIYKECSSASTETALASVKDEIGKVRDGISKLKVKFCMAEKHDTISENAELIKKLDEVKEFLDKLP